MPKKTFVGSAVERIGSEREKFFYRYLHGVAGRNGRIKDIAVQTAEQSGITRL